MYHSTKGRVFKYWSLVFFEFCYLKPKVCNTYGYLSTSDDSHQIYIPLNQSQRMKGEVSTAWHQWGNKQIWIQGADYLKNIDLFLFLIHKHCKLALILGSWQCGFRHISRSSRATLNPCRIWMIVSLLEHSLEWSELAFPPATDYFQLAGSWQPLFLLGCSRVH